MFSHIVLGADDLDAAKAFYDAALGALGAPPGRFGDKGRLIYMNGGSLLMITQPINGEPASCANGGTIGFRAVSPEAVDAWHAAGVAHGERLARIPPASGKPAWAICTSRIRAIRRGTSSAAPIAFRQRPDQADG